MTARSLRYALACLAAAVSVAITATPASAHVLIDTVQPRGDGSVTITFTFEHGCSGKPTTGLAITVPTGSAVIGADEPEGWTHHSDQGLIRFNGTAIPDHQRAQFVLHARIQADVGSTVLFPTLQQCAGGASLDWSAAAEDADYPAPRFVATAATVDPALSSTPQGNGATPGQVLTATALYVGLAVTAAAEWVRRRRLALGGPGQRRERARPPRARH